MEEKEKDREKKRELEKLRTDRKYLLQELSKLDANIREKEGGKKLLKINILVKFYKVPFIN